MTPPDPADLTAPPDPNWTVARTIREHGQSQPGAAMLTFGDRSVTYGDVDRRSSQLAQGLLALGVGSQDRIAFLDKNGPEYFEVLFGGGKINAVNVAVNWRLNAREMEYIINDADAKVLFVGEEFLPQLDVMEPDLTSVKKIIVIGSDTRHESYDSWVSAQPVEDPGFGAEPDDVALQLYTSGTTGLPKGAMLTNRSLGRVLPSVAPNWEVDATSVSLVALPLFHVGGSAWALLSILAGGRCVLLRDMVPAEVLELIEREKVSNAFLVPALLNFMSLVPGAAERDYSALRTIVYGASPMPEDVLDRSIQTFRCKFLQVYGLTETTGPITDLTFRDHQAAGADRHLLRSAGKPYAWVDLRIVDTEGADLPVGQVGELWTRSVQNMKGYWNHPDETAEAFEGDWFKTGDAGYRDEDGYLYLTDRVKDMIISGGENIYPAEVENALAHHPAVADVGVIGVPDEKWGETVKAIVVAKEGTDPSAEELIGFARERLASYKCPTSVDFIDVLPRNPSGKILKKDLREPFWKGQKRRIH